jgi:hypothetical protein
MNNRQELLDGAKIGDGTKVAGTCSKPRRGHQSHGHTALKRAIKTLGSRSIDRRTSLGKALDIWRNELIADLGGESAVSTQQKALVGLCVTTKLMLDSLDAWLLSQGSLVNVRKRSVIPALLSRTQLSDSLARYLGQLGLARKARPVQSLDQLLHPSPEPTKETAA